MRNAPIIVLASIAIFAFGFFAFASSPFDIEFPIAELGGCADKESCRVYCDDLTHKNACVEFAKKYGFIDEAEAERAKKMPAIGPGGCSSESECRAYCDDVNHTDECLSFGEKHNLIGKEELKRAREFSGQTGPGGCRGANECRVYCEDKTHQEQCLAFAHRKGLVSDRDAEVTRIAIREGGPGGCKGENDCRAYCNDPSHLDECLAFGERHGVVSKEEVLRVKKVALDDGPGGCDGIGECHAYCEDAAHHVECVEFAERNGFMSPEEADRARKLAGKTGPGGCRGNECRAFCEKPENAKECLVYGEREGLITKGEAERINNFVRAIQEGGPGSCRGQTCRAYCEDSSRHDECFQFAKKQGLVKAGDEENFEAGKKVQKKMEEHGGPGGCRNEKDCAEYCFEASHTEECVAFGVAHGGFSEDEVRRMMKEFNGRRFEIHSDVNFHPDEDVRRFEGQTLQSFGEFKLLEEQFRSKNIPGSFVPSGGAPARPPEPSLPAEPSRPGEIPRPGETPRPTEVPTPGEPSGREEVFLGPAGCNSPSACIKYCKENKDECFSFGEPGKPEARPGEGGVPPGRGEPRRHEDEERHEPVRLRGGLIERVRVEELKPHEREEIFERHEEERQPVHREEVRRQPEEPPAGERREERSAEFREGEQRQGEFQPREGERHEFSPFQGIGPIPGTPGIFGPLTPPPFPQPLPQLLPSLTPPTFHAPPTGTLTPPPPTGTFIFPPPPPPTGTFVPPTTDTFILPPPPPPTDTSILPPPPPSTIFPAPEITCQSGFVLEKDRFGTSYCAPTSCGPGAVLKILDDGRKTCFIGAGFNYPEQFLLHPFAGILNFFLR